MSNTRSQDIEEPSLRKARTLMNEPAVMKSSTDMCEPNLHIPYTLQLLPNLANCLMEKAEATLQKSSTETPEPSDTSP